MNNQEAIKELKVIYFPFHAHAEAINMSILALQEQEEREKGCKWCNGLTHGGNAYGDSIRELEIRANITQGYFCPKCGRPLK